MLFKKSNYFRIICGLFVFIPALVEAKNNTYKPPNSFREAKPIINKITRQIYNYTLYCNCPINWTSNGKKGAPQLKKCGYKARKRPERAERIEVEHIVPASVLAKGMACWKHGGRRSCRKNSEYNKMAGNLYNLWPAVGEVNADRNNYPYGLVSKPFVTYGQCQMKISFKQDLADPPEQVKGLVARTYLYMSDKYHVTLSTQQRALYNQWNKHHPASAWEKQRAAKIKQYMGSNFYY